MFITALSLNAFRNYAGLALTDLPSGLIAFAGANGAGKTNILEAISLLSPGRGLRNADVAELQARDAQVTSTPWAIHARVMGAYGPQDLGLGLDPIKNRRTARLNGDAAKSHADMAELFRCVWLTPQHDRLFLDGASGRRKFIDRWVFTADPAHAGRITRLERLLAERNRLLSMQRADPIWLNALELDLASTAVAVASARIDYLDRLRTKLATATDHTFPEPIVTFSGTLEDRIGREPSVAIENDYRDMLARNRARDAEVEATTIGPHRSDLHVIYAAKNMPAATCSTGEQKALLFALFLAHVRLICDECGEAPVLLLDEITAHLDPARRDGLLDQLNAFGAQVMMTATTPEPFTTRSDVQIYTVNDAQVQPYNINNVTPFQRAG